MTEAAAPTKKPRKAKAKKEVDPAYQAFCNEYSDRKKLLSLISKKALDLAVVGVSSVKLLKAVYEAVKEIKEPEAIVPDYTLDILYAVPVSLQDSTVCTEKAAELLLAFKHNDVRAEEMKARGQCKCKCTDCQPELIRRCHRYIVEKQ